MLDAADLPEVSILASGDLDEHRIAALLADGAPIDAFGVGTQLGTSADAPALGAVYKLVEDVAGPKMKLASGKVTLPGRKQVWRRFEDGIMADDVLTLDRISVFDPAKDRPILFSALAWANILLTLDRNDFASLLGSEFYGLAVRTPGMFLEQERKAGRLRYKSED